MSDESFRKDLRDAASGDAEALERAILAAVRSRLDELGVVRALQSRLARIELAMGLPTSDEILPSTPEELLADLARRVRTLEERPMPLMDQFGRWLASPPDPGQPAAAPPWFVPRPVVTPAPSYPWPPDQQTTIIISDGSNLGYGSNLALERT